MGCVIGSLCSCLVFPAPSAAEFADQWAEFRQAQAQNLVWLKSSRGDECPALYIKPVGGGSAQLTVLYSHGNAEDITQIYTKFELLASEFGVAFLLYEYSGYSLSSGGGPSEASFYANIEAVRVPAAAAARRAQAGCSPLPLPLPLLLRAVLCHRGPSLHRAVCAQRVTHRAGPPASCMYFTRRLTRMCTWYACMCLRARVACGVRACRRSST
jgi:hypothetical protein